MNIFLLIVVFVISLTIGIIGFCQIIGSLQNLLARKAILTAFTICFWMAILIGEFFFVYYLLPNQITAYYIGTGLAFLLSLGAGKIE